MTFEICCEISLRLVDQNISLQEWAQGEIAILLGGVRVSTIMYITLLIVTMVAIVVWVSLSLYIKWRTMKILEQAPLYRNKGIHKPVISEKGLRDAAMRVASIVGGDRKERLLEVKKS